MDKFINMTIDDFLKLQQTIKEIKEYYAKIYPKTDDKTLHEFAEAFVSDHKRKVYLADVFPNLKIEDIEVLNQLITDQDIEQYERDRGN